MGILFNISALGTSVCLTGLISGGLLNLTRKDRICFLIGMAIGTIFMILSIFLRGLFPNNGGWF